MPCVLFVSDFFVPDLGGVETHIYQLSQRLIDLGYKVVVLTRFRGHRHGVRWMANGLKVIYLPYFPSFMNSGHPSMMYYLPLFRHILIREDVDIVHAHGAASNIGIECIAFSRMMGYPTVYTDHSMFGFADIAGINLNKIFRAVQSCFLDRMISVSQANKENAYMRSGLPYARIYVIPNAVEAGNFTPDPGCRPNVSERINIVVVSRLAPRKGIRLLEHVIPRICAAYSKVHFLIGGDGPERLLMEEMIEKYNVHEQVTMFGSINATEVRNVLVQGHIFLNTSLTEAFCIALLEAVTCGLLCVSTNVGGVPEVLPSRFVRLAEANVESLVTQVRAAIASLEDHGIPDAWEIHAEVKGMYTWINVAKRVSKVYVELLHHEGRMRRKVSSASRRRTIVRNAYDLGLIWGKLWVLIVSYIYLVWRLLEWLDPADKIPKAINLANAKSPFRPDELPNLKKLKRRQSDAKNESNYG